VVYELFWRDCSRLQCPQAVLHANAVEDLIGKPILWPSTDFIDVIVTQSAPNSVRVCYGVVEHPWRNEAARIRCWEPATAESWWAVLTWAFMFGRLPQDSLPIQRARKQGTRREVMC